VVMVWTAVPEGLGELSLGKGEVVERGGGYECVLGGEGWVELAVNESSFFFFFFFFFTPFGLVLYLPMMKCFGWR
jgi:hypothetical protein